MKVLVISNMYPTPAHPALGVFVARRVLAYRRLGAKVTVVANHSPAKPMLWLVAKYAWLAMRSVGVAVVNRPSVIEAHYLLPTGVIGAVASIAARRPLVLVAHGSDVALTKSGLRHRVTRWAVRRASAVHVNSEALAQSVAAQFPDAPLPLVVPPGIDLDDFQPKTSSDRAGSSYRVCFIGALEHHKGLDVLIEALSGSDWELSVVGSGSRRAELEGLASGAGLRVEWLGVLDPAALAEVLRSCDVLVLPSRRDAFGVVVVEALATGTAVVVTDVGGPAEIPTPQCGAVVPANDPEALRLALNEWLPRSRERRTQVAARQRAVDFAAAPLARRALSDLERVSVNSHG